MVRTTPLQRLTNFRHGYTLLELALVMAILGTLLSISWPMVIRVYSDYDLKRSGQDVRLKLLATRNLAIRNGMVYQFRIEPGGVGYFAMPLESTGEETQAQDASMPDRGELSEGLQFMAAPEMPLYGEQISTGSLAGFVSFRDLAGTEWSQPFLFFPDGTAQSVGFRIADEEGRFVSLWVNQLTGSVELGPVEREAVR